MHRPADTSGFRLIIQYVCSCGWVDRNESKESSHVNRLFVFINFYIFLCNPIRTLDGCLWNCEKNVSLKLFLKMTSKPLSTNGTPVEPSTVIRFDESGKSWESKSGFWAFRFFDGLSSTWEFAILTFGVFFFYSWYGICMETFFR